MAVVGGLIVSQVLTLYITTVVYIYLDKIDSLISGARDEDRSANLDHAAQPAE